MGLLVSERMIWCIVVRTVLTSVVARVMRLGVEKWSMLEKEKLQHDLQPAEDRGSRRPAAVAAQAALHVPERFLFCVRFDDVLPPAKFSWKRGREKRPRYTLNIYYRSCVRFASVKDCFPLIHTVSMDIFYLICMVRVSHFRPAYAIMSI